MATSSNYSDNVDYGSRNAARATRAQKVDAVGAQRLEELIRIQDGAVRWQRLTECAVERFGEVTSQMIKRQASTADAAWVFALSSVVHRCLSYLATTSNRTDALAQAMVRNLGVIAKAMLDKASAQESEYSALQQAQNLLASMTDESVNLNVTKEEHRSSMTYMQELAIVSTKGRQLAIYELIMPDGPTLKYVRP
jgi:hypothetical protein